jgi:hypothetical protein
LKQGIVVHGMSRSGTSAVTGVFVRAGFFAGRPGDLLAANEFNPRGHHENLGVISANERVLGQIGGTWFEAPAAAECEQVDEWASRMLRDEVDRLNREADGRPLVVKDPRIDVMMPIWRSILGPGFHPVLVVRNPVEIALSLRSRDETPLPFALASWELHMAELLSHLNGQTVTIAPFARLSDEPELAERVVESAATHIDPALRARIDPAEARDGIEPELRHHAVSVGDELDLLTIKQRELWRTLDSLPPGDQTLSLPPDVCVPSPSAREIAHAETQRAWDLSQQRILIEALESERARNAALAADLGDARVHGAEVTAELQRALTLLAAVFDSVSWRLTTPLRAAKRSVGQRRH